MDFLKIIDYVQTIILSFILLLVLELTSCNTVEGAGRDIESAGENMQKSAVEHKEY